MSVHSESGEPSRRHAKPSPQPVAADDALPRTSVFDPKDTAPAWWIDADGRLHGLP